MEHNVTEFTWDLSDIYESKSEWKHACLDAESLIQQFRDLKETDIQTGAEFADQLGDRDRLFRTLSKISLYATLQLHKDVTNTQYEEMYEQAVSLKTEANKVIEFLESKPLRMDRETLDRWLKSSEKLSIYGHFIDNIVRTRPHTRSSEVEPILADFEALVGASKTTYDRLRSSDLCFPSVEDTAGDAVTISVSNFTALQRDPNREFREAVYRTFYDEWEAIEHTATSLYRCCVSGTVKLARHRNYDSAKEASLDQSNIPTTVYDTLLDTVRANLEPLRRYVELKETALNLDQIRMWDIYMPINSDASTVPYDEAASHVIKSVEPLGEDYQRTVKRAIESRWIDVYEAEGKRSGAYTAWSYDTHPYVLLNYQDDIESMYTLAHEIGHVVHTVLAHEAQPYIYSDYDPFVAEIASTVNEALLTHHLLKTANNEHIRIRILGEYLERFRTVLYRQALFSAFEDQIYHDYESGESLTVERLNSLYRDLKSEFYGPELVDERIAREWMRISHLYDGFSVYQYAAGMSAAITLSRDILKGGIDTRERYLEFLRAGSSEYPLDLLKMAGVDMSTSDPVRRALDHCSVYVTRLEKLLNTTAV